MGLRGQNEALSGVETPLLSSAVLEQERIHVSLAANKDVVLWVVDRLTVERRRRNREGDSTRNGKKCCYLEGCVSRRCYVRTHRANMLSGYTGLHRRTTKAHLFLGNHVFGTILCPP